MRAAIEPPHGFGWGPARVTTARLERDGYPVTGIRSPQHVLLARSGPGQAGGPHLLPGYRRAAVPDSVTAGLPERPHDTLPVLPAFAPLLPGGGLAKGAVVAVDQPGALCLALAAGASQAGMWCGVAGIPELGVVAAAGMGIEPDRMMLVPEPGPRWAEVAAVMLAACEVVLLRPPGHVPATLRRRVETVACKNGSALIVAAEWEGAPIRLAVAWQQWKGAGDGYGRLRARLTEVVADGRGALARPRRARLWLPGPDGKVTTASDVDAPSGLDRVNRAAGLRHRTAWSKAAR